MSEARDEPQPTRPDRLRERVRWRLELLADRRARRRAKGGDFQNAARQAEGEAWESGGFFTKNTKPRS